MKIRTRKAIKGGIAGRIIIGFEGIKKYDQLPKEYLDTEINTYMNTDDIHLKVPHIDGCRGLTLNEWMPEPVFQTTLRAIRMAGNRLHRINKAKKLAKWAGEESFVI